MRKKLVSDETLKAYKDYFEKMIKNVDIEEGYRLFISRVTAVSGQIDNMHVKASVGDYVLENDGPEDLGGSGKIPGPMQTLIASLTNCLEITDLLYLSLSNLKVNSINVKVEALYDKRSTYNPKKEPFSGFYDIKYVWHIDTDENLKKIDHILKKAKEVYSVKETYKKHHEFPRKIKMVKKNT